MQNKRYETSQYTRRGLPVSTVIIVISIIIITSFVSCCRGLELVERMSSRTVQSDFRYQFQVRKCNKLLFCWGAQKPRRRVIKADWRVTYIWLCELEMCCGTQRPQASWGSCRTGIMLLHCDPRHCFLASGIHFVCDKCSQLQMDRASSEDMGTIWFRGAGPGWSTKSAVLTTFAFSRSPLERNFCAVT